MVKLAHKIPDKWAESIEGMSVCELGNQTIKPEISKKYQVKTASEFFKKMGFSSYTAIDVNTNLDAIAMDLNYVLKDRYEFNKTYDVVTNNGTGEHLFNQYALFANMHNLCKKDGFMLHILPFYKQCDHGFFSYHPNLFGALAHQNDYEFLETWISTSPVNYCVNIDIVPERQTTLAEDMGVDQWHPKWGPELAVLMRKKTDKEFEIPMQRLYSGDNITDGEIFEQYKDINK
tara:strand:+ start:63 stop:758 length:696 start_codon:yes stop_codon:yes gene_type:complete